MILLAWQREFPAPAHRAADMWHTEYSRFLLAAQRGDQALC